MMILVVDCKIEGKEKQPSQFGTLLLILALAGVAGHREAR